MLKSEVKILFNNEYDVEKRKVEKRRDRAERERERYQAEDSHHPWNRWCPVVLSSP